MYSQIVRRIVAPAWAAWERSPYLMHYRKLLKTQFLKEEDIRKRQILKIERITRHACDKSAFWQKRFNESGYSVDTEFDLQKFRDIPLLTKDDLRNSGSDLLAAGIDPRSLQRKSTSGSTGVSVIVYVDDAAQQFKRACTLRSDEWSGWRLGEPVASVWGNPEYLSRGWRGLLRNSVLDRARYLDTVSMTLDSMRKYLNELRKRPPSLLYGHAHSLYLFAVFCENEGGAGFRPRAIISTAMVLHAGERAKIEKVFGVPVTNRYGCEEVSLIACQCEKHGGLHVNSDAIFLEILRPDGSQCEPGETGAIVVTDLVNHAMPIIRYQIGDMAKWSREPCPCGRGLPTIDGIEGRVADYVVTATGELISGISLTENFAVLIPGLAQLQIVQETVHKFLFRIVKGPDWSAASVEMIRDKVHQRFGSTVEFELEFVEKILQEKSGKYRFCISKVQNPYSSIGSA